ncbi:hypothetical protein TNCV_5044731 [Trichonephila clavipes]|uniref:Uncharacterized protein n=1 Tax=Trichonephila clavipes TaxID=2585209 RepID=A0A8X6WHF7_TRICX|nr:hypothetical protein TNCV_5044731 [Trichonephila clavipes]
MIDRISICEALTKRNEIDPFLKWMVTGYEKGVTYDNIVRKRSWSKRGEAAQTRTNIQEGSTVYLVLDESRSFFRVHTGYFSNIPKCIKAEFIASWACSQSSVVSSSQR